jgi:hypothetical protein
LGSENVLDRDAAGQALERSRGFVAALEWEVGAGV